MNLKGNLQKLRVSFTNVLSMVTFLRGSVGMFHLVVSAGYLQWLAVLTCCKVLHGIGTTAYCISADAALHPWKLMLTWHVASCRCCVAVMEFCKADFQPSMVPAAGAALPSMKLL